MAFVGMSLMVLALTAAFPATSALQVGFSLGLLLISAGNATWEIVVSLAVLRVMFTGCGTELVLCSMWCGSVGCVQPRFPHALHREMAAGSKCKSTLPHVSARLGVSCNVIFFVCIVTLPFVCLCSDVTRTLYHAAPTAAPTTTAAAASTEETMDRVAAFEPISGTDWDCFTGVGSMPHMVIASANKVVAPAL